MRHALMALLVMGTLAGCTPSSGSDNPYPPVPALLPDTPTKPPVTAEQLLWQPGHWDWTGSGYAWTAGEWVPAAGHGGRFMPGWWSKTPAGYVWQPPHWIS